MIRAEAEDMDLYNGLDTGDWQTKQTTIQAKERMEKKTCWHHQVWKHKDYVPSEDEDSRGGKIVKRKEFVYKPMSEEDAICKWNFWDTTSLSLITETEKLPSSTKRKDGHYGLIDINKKSNKTKNKS